MKTAEFLQQYNIDPNKVVYTGTEEDDERDGICVSQLLREYAQQFDPKWVSVDEFQGEVGQMVLVKGIIEYELGGSSEPSTGLVNWKNKDYSECSDCCYYAMWYTNITEVFTIPKTV